MTGYTRQSAASMIVGAEITAAMFNAEFNLLQTAFGVAGHEHTGTSGNGPKLSLTSAITGVLPVANGGFSGIHKTNATTAPTVNDDSGDGYAVGSHWVDVTNGDVYIATDVTLGAAAWEGILDTDDIGGLVQAYDVDLTAIAALTGTGIAVRTNIDTWALRTITGPANGITVSNGSGALGDPTLALSDDLAALEALSTTGLASRTGSNTWVLLSTLGLLPVGLVADYAGLTEPTGWLFCYGQPISRTTYSALFALLSTTYGVGDGSTTFNLPDLRGRVTAGKDDMGGSSANRLTGLSGGIDGDTLGGVGGSEIHTLSLGEIPSHNHGGATGADGGHTHGTGSGSFPNFVINNGSALAAMEDTAGTTNVLFGNGDISRPVTIESVVDHTHTIPSAGSGQAHNNVQPTFILNKMIYTGV